MKSQKISVYLIKEGLPEHSDIVQDTENSLVLSTGVLFYKESFIKPPRWAIDFFNTEIAGLKNSTSSGIFLTNIIYNEKKLVFAISFGHGWQMLRSGVIVEQFGIKTVLSMVKNSNKIRKIEKKNFKNGLKDVSEQLGQAGSISDFGFDVEQDLIRAVVGEPENTEYFGKNIVGKDAFSFSVKRDADNINEVLIDIYKTYISERYKEEYPWFDNFSSVQDKGLIKSLNEMIVSSINNIDRNSDVIFWLSIPEVIEWESVKFFKYSRNSENDYCDIDFNEFRNSLPVDKRSSLSVEDLRSKKVFVFGLDGQVNHQWSIFKCLYAEVGFGGKKYLLVSQKYYEVEPYFMLKTEDEFTIDSQPVLPDWDVDLNESDYNKGVYEGDPLIYQCLDGGVDQNNLIDFGGRKKSIEFADLVTTNKQLIHVKKYGGSSVLSHLFNQGYVSAELFLKESLFRKAVNSKLRVTHDFVAKEKIQPTSNEYTIVFAIGSKKDLKLPFFSMVSFNNIKKQLKLYGYNVALVRIKQV